MPLPDSSGDASSAAPVYLELERVCAFKAKPCKECGKPKSSRDHTPKKTATCQFKRQNGCAKCGRNKGAIEHFGEPPSFNVSAGRNPNVYRAELDHWKALLFDLLSASELPRGCARILAEGEAVFPTAAKRDQGNFRVTLEKALGDALQEGGWLPDDSWSHYEFGNLTYRYLPGRSATRLALFPTLNEQMEFTT